SGSHTHSADGSEMYRKGRRGSRGRRAEPRAPTCLIGADGGAAGHGTGGFVEESTLGVQGPDAARRLLQHEAAVALLVAEVPLRPRAHKQKAGVIVQQEVFWRGDEVGAELSILFHVAVLVGLAHQ